MRHFKAIAMAVLACVHGPLVTAHEFWLEPVDYTVAEGGRIEARAINGEDFAGREYSYSATGYKASGVVAGASRTGIGGQTGDRPAVSVMPAGSGLNILYHQSSVQSLTYDTFEKFATFIRGKKLDPALEAHRAKGFPETGIREAYFRFVKALVAVGDGAGADQAVGMPIELVALRNPYTSPGDIPVRLLRRGQPMSGAYVYVFRRAGPGQAATKIELRTDADGTVVVPAAAGGEFMVNAVDITEAQGRIKDATRAQWVTLWASLTFSVSR